MDETPPPQSDSREPMTLPDVVRVVFSGRDRFAEFAGAYLTRENPPAFMLVAWLLGMDGVAAALELEYLTTGAHLVDNWFHAWLRIMFAGVGAAVVRYWLVGSAFHGIVRMAGGHALARTSRCVFLYAALPLVIVELAVKVVQMLVYGNNYFAGLTNPALDGVTAGVMLMAMAYSVMLGYSAMRRVLGADRGRSLVVLALVGVIVLVFSAMLFFKGGA
jgi:hypothetical protein